MSLGPGPIPLAAALACAAALTGCTARPAPLHAHVQDYELALTTRPSPLEVGRNAQLTLRLTRAGRPQTGCTMRMRQRMDGMGMDSDERWTGLESAGGGEYRGASAGFGMGGDWLLEFSWSCGGSGAGATLPVHIAWPS